MISSRKNIILSILVVVVLFILPIFVTAQNFNYLPADMQKNIDALGSVPVASLPMPVLFGVDCILFYFVDISRDIYYTIFHIRLACRIDIFLRLVVFFVMLFDVRFCVLDRLCTYSQLYLKVYHRSNIGWIQRNGVVSVGFHCCGFF